MQITFYIRKNTNTEKMKVSYFLALLLIAVASTTVSGNCGEIIKCFDKILNGKLNRQIAVQIKGQYTFLYLAQLYDRDHTFYKDIAGFFRTTAANHLKHAIRFMEYQNQRGGTVEMGGKYEVDLFTDYACDDIQSKNASSAFECAMQIQANVTNELAELRDDALGITIDNVANKCTGDIVITDADTLLLTQALLVNCQLSPGGGGIVKTGNWRTCSCDSINDVNYGELAEMIATDFLNQQSKERKEMSNYYNTLMGIEPSLSAIAQSLLDTSIGAE